MVKKNRKKMQRGFTLIELMIVVAIIGILAVIAVIGVRKWLASAKSAEATNTIGAINRAAVAAYERESAPSEILIGQSSATTVRQLCDDAQVVPGAIADVANKKYTANTAPGTDYNQGTQTQGWTCLKFAMNEPQAYRYTYAKAATCNGGVTTAAGLPGGLNWVSCAEGDLDANNVLSAFTTGGQLSNGVAVPVTTIAQQNPEE